MQRANSSMNSEAETLAPQFEDRRSEQASCRLAVLLLRVPRLRAPRIHSAVYLRCSRKSISGWWSSRGESASPALVVSEPTEVESAECGAAIKHQSHSPIPSGLPGWKARVSKHLVSVRTLGSHHMRHHTRTGTRLIRSSPKRKITQSAEVDSFQLIFESPKRRSSNRIGVSVNEQPTARQR